MCAVSLLESREQRYIKAMNINNYIQSNVWTIYDQWLMEIVWLMHMVIVYFVIVKLSKCFHEDSWVTVTDEFRCLFHVVLFSLLVCAGIVNKTFWCVPSASRSPRKERVPSVSISLPICLCVYLSVYVYIYLSVCLSRLQSISRCGVVWCVCVCV